MHDSENGLSSHFYVASIHAPCIPIRPLVALRRVAEVAVHTSTRPANPTDSFDELSYSKQYDQLFQQQPLPIKQPVPKPSKVAQAQEPDSKKVLLSDVHATKKVNMFLNRKWNGTDYGYVAFMLFAHGLALLAPFTFSWGNVALFFGTYFITGCLGITLSFHRQLSHKSFQTPSWVEYVLAYCGVLAVQGDPIEWVSSHRYHHLHTDTPLDPHSPYEGFWWSHMGWLLDNQVRACALETFSCSDCLCVGEGAHCCCVAASHVCTAGCVSSSQWHVDFHAPSLWFSHACIHLPFVVLQTTLERVYDRKNAIDLENQWFYRFIRDTYIWHVVAQFGALYMLGGLPAMVWGGALRMVWVYHITWFVNSAAHCWGSQSYNTGDLSRNNWWVSVLAFGEGWHNNHHAFEFSARHGLEWWQFDMTWMMVCALEKLGLASNVKLPSEKQKARLAFAKA